MSVRMYDDIVSSTNRAVQIFNILIGLAYNRQTITYKKLAEIMNFDGAGVFSHPLDHILHWCKDSKLPSLTVLVVNSKSGLPGSGFSTHEDLHAQREKVYAENWYRIIPPTMDELNAAYQKRKT
ncbi:hypothetical protein [Pseudochrobactrum sp. XF203]|uniref:hypothetical protein n=1 Tax=Pseudochrobactrum sp. XF203 TaxID=2879116 RepID=UPI001CE2FA8B|nr:hypothetical protein [Pseudochrobactrum sp. XF203]UCA47021.1 hypothetical protein LDL70_07425 [Pseudochrobactrum sp. XF203]